MRNASDAYLIILSVKNDNDDNENNEYNNNWLIIWVISK